MLFSIPDKQRLQGEKTEFVGAKDKDSGVFRTGLPDMIVISRDVPSPTNALGVKGAGECGTVAAPPAVIHALIDALSSYGVRSIEMPATPERVWRAIRAGNIPHHSHHSHHSTRSST